MQPPEPLPEPILIPEYCWIPPHHLPGAWCAPSGKDLAQDVHGPPNGVPRPQGTPPELKADLTPVFEWILQEIVGYLTRFDQAVKTQNEGAYIEARAEYLTFIKRLDNRDLGEPAAQVIKWVYVMPTIRAGTIQGVTVVVEWNPSSSSSTIRR